MGRLADDLRAEFPEVKGLSRRNLFYMRGFAAAWPDPIVHQAVAQLPWGHITVLLDKAETPEERVWYASAAVEYGWSRNVLMNMMMNKTLERTGAAPSNLVQQLVAPDSELAQQVAKDPYNSEFLGLSGEVAERDLAQALMDRITDTLREMGPGFAFVGARSTSTSAGTTSTLSCSSSTSNSSVTSSSSSRPASSSPNTPASLTSTSRWSTTGSAAKATPIPSAS